MAKLKFSDGNFHKVKVTGKINHFGSNEKFYEVVDEHSARHYVPKKLIINFPKKLPRPIYGSQSFY